MTSGALAPVLAVPAVLLALLAALLAGAATGSVTTTGDAPGPLAVGDRSTHPDRGRVRLDGALRRPSRFTVRDLAAQFPQQTVTTTFTAQGVPTTRTFTGPLLLDVLTAAEPRFDDRQSNDQLAFAVRVGATDGYRAVVAWGEIDPGFAGTQVLLATTEDGVPLARPRLVVPGDARGGRYVTDVDRVTLVDLGDVRGRGHH